MKTTLDDLRVALHEQAHLTPYPNVDALVAGAQRRVGLARRRRLAAFGASTAAVLLLGGLMVSTGSSHRAALQPAKPGLGNFSVNAAGAGFPEFIQGMRRVTVLDAPMLARMKGSISIPTTPGDQLSVQMTCTWPKDSTLIPSASPDTLKDLLIKRMVKLSFTGPRGKVISGCWAPVETDTSIGATTARQPRCRPMSPWRPTSTRAWPLPKVRGSMRPSTKPSPGRHTLPSTTDRREDPHLAYGATPSWRHSGWHGRERSPDPRDPGSDLGGERQQPPFLQVALQPQEPSGAAGAQARPATCAPERQQHQRRAGPPVLPRHAKPRQLQQHRYRCRLGDGPCETATSPTGTTNRSSQRSRSTPR